MNRKCKNHPNNFCFICGKVVLAGQSSNITSFVKASYHAYFGLKLGDQDKVFAPHICCRTCVEYLRRWSTGKIKALPFGIPMMWREGKDHVTDCYFCLTNIQGVNKKNKYCVKYPDVPSAIKPVPHGPDIPVPDPPQSLKLDSVSDDEISTADTSETYIQPSCSQNDPQPLTQSQLNDLTRDLGLSKESSQLLGSRLRESNLLALETTFYWYRNRDQEFRQFFSSHDTTSLIYCSDIKGLIEALGVMYKPSEWRLFIDSSSRSLKAVLLHNGNGLGSVPVGYSIQLTENYENLKTLLDVLKYNDHQWKLCCDLKVITLILGMQGGYTKYPCFLCLWDSRADDKHFKQNQWQPRISFRPGFQNVIAQPLLDRNNILLPPLHIKLGLMKNYVKAMNKESDAFLYIHKKFPHISDGKLLAGIFDGPQIRSLMKDDEFEVTMNQIEKETWINFKLITTNFLGNHRNPQYKDMVKNLLESFKKMGVRMSIKIHFLASHLEYFPANCGDFSEEQGERFHQDVRTMEERYQGRWDINMMADYCWCLKRDEPVKTHKRKAIRSSFLKNNLEM